MENLSKIANAIISPRPELELTRIACDMLSNRNLALTTESSELCQTIVVDAYFGIQQKLGRTKIDSDLISNALNEVTDLLGAGEILGNMQNQNPDGGLSSEQLKDVLDGLGIKVNVVGNGGVGLANEEDLQRYNEGIEAMKNDLMKQSTPVEEPKSPEETTEPQAATDTDNEPIEAIAEEAVTQ